MTILNVIKRSRLEGALRIEAEFYKPEDLAMLAKLRSLGSRELAYYCAFIKKGVFDLPPSNYTNDGVPLIRTSEIKSIIADLSSVVRIKTSTHQNNAKTELESGDLVFTKIGANIGDVAILPSTDKVYNFSQNVAGAKIHRNRIAPEYLACFFSTRYGRSQIKRIQMLSGQGKLELVDIKKLLVPPASDGFQRAIANVFFLAGKKLVFAKERYAEAEQLLLAELGLLNWIPPRALTYIRQYSEVFHSQRLDAEHFQPMYDKIIVRIAKFTPKRLSMFASQILETTKFHDGKTYRYIEIGDVNPKTGEVGFTEREIKDLPPNAKIKIKGGELIVSKVRPTRGAVGVVSEDCKENGVCSSAFTVLHVSSPMREFLQVYLRSVVGKSLLEKQCKGTSYPTIDDIDVKNLPVPIIDDKKIEKISALVMQSDIARREAKELLEKAKRAVEMKIEISEDVGFRLVA